MSDINTIQWSIQKRFLFLCILSYTFFYIFPFPFDAFPQLNFIFNIYEKVNDGVVLWIGKNIFQLHNFQKLIFSDSGDTTFDFVKFFIFLILSIVTALTILIVDKKRNNYEKLQSYLFIYIRYCIGFYMLVYGFDKVFKSHFPFPSLEKLEQTFGESSPQGLLWAFMGYSSSYTIYLGIIEVIAGFLLLFRRTTALGALLTLMIMINVAVINFSYDVPVKLFALHMVGFALVLLYTFFNSIFQFFILKRETKLAEQKEIIFPTFIQKYRKAIKAVIIISFTLLFMSFSWTNMKTDGDSAPKQALYGIYEHSLFNYDNTEIIANLAQRIEFDKIIFDSKNTIIISFEDETKYYTTKTDTINRIIDFKSNTDTTETFQLNYEIKSEFLKLNGIIETDSVTMIFKKIDLNSFPLINRKFHWVVEYPVNN